MKNALVKTSCGTMRNALSSALTHKVIRYDKIYDPRKDDANKLHIKFLTVTAKRSNLSPTRVHKGTNKDDAEKFVNKIFDGHANTIKFVIHACSKRKDKDDAKNLLRIFFDMS